MKRLFGKFSRSSPAATGEPTGQEPDAEPEAPGSPDPAASDDHRQPEKDAPEFELREPTAEEKAATIMSRQDFIDLDRIFSDEPAPKRVLQQSKAPLLSPAVVMPVPRRPVQSPPPIISDTAPAGVATRPNEIKKPSLVGFLEGFFLGKALGGWVGDPADPSSRSLRVTAYLDGEPVASTVANRQRKDIPYGGYHVPFEDPQVWKYLLEDRLILRARRDDDEEPFILRPLEGVFKQAYAERARVLGSTEEEKLDAPLVPKPHGIKDLSYVRVPVGMESRDGAAIVGHDGFLFGYRDASNIAAQYKVARDQDADVKRDAGRWYALFRAREAVLAEQGIAYVQTIMPDKATILNDFSPIGLGPITPRLAVLEAMIEAEPRKEGAEPIAYYRSLVAALRSCHAAGVAPYLRTANGLRTAGTQLIFYQLVQKLTALLPDHAEAFEKIADLCGFLAAGKESDPFSGDLGQRFDFPLYETEQLPDLTRLAPFLAGDPDIADVPAEGDASGRFVWRNPAAPCSLKVAVFESGTFQKGVEAVDLSWWFKTMFAEFHLIQRIELDGDSISENRPDVVICMSLERSLPKPPEK